MAIVIKEIKVVSTVEKRHPQPIEIPPEWLGKLKEMLREEQSKAERNLTKER